MEALRGWHFFVLNFSSTLLVYVDWYTNTPSRRCFELQAQTKHGPAQVFHFKLYLEVSHCFLSVPCGPDDVQIIDMDRDDAKSIVGFLYET